MQLRSSSAAAGSRARAGPSAAAAQSYAEVEARAELAGLLEAESASQPASDYLERSTVLTEQSRAHTVAWFEKVCGEFSLGFTSYCIAVSLLDRFLSLYHLKDHERWVVQLTAVACMSMACKLQRRRPSCTLQQLQASTPWEADFDGLQVQRMESIVLHTLDGKTDAITVAAVLCALLKLLRVLAAKDAASELDKATTCCHRLLQHALPVSHYLRYRPSVLAAASLSLGVQTSCPRRLAELQQAGGEHVNSQAVAECTHELQLEFSELLAEMRSGSRRSSSLGATDQDRSTDTNETRYTDETAPDESVR